MQLTNEQLSAELEKIRGLLASGATMTGPASPVAMPPGMFAPGPMVSPGGGGLRPVGLMVSISVPTPNGDVPCYLQLGPEAAGNPQGAIQQLMQAGWPVKCWAPRQGTGGWGNGGGGGWGRRGWGR